MHFNTKEKILTAVFLIITLAFGYNLFFRYEYKIYKDVEWDGGYYVIKLDKFTGEADIDYLTYSGSKLYADIDKEIKKEEKMKTKNIIERWKK